MAGLKLTGKRIWKYELPDPTCYVSIPNGAVLLKAAVQRGKVCVWALVDPDAVPIGREFITVGTGHSFPDHITEQLTYVDTVFFDNGLVFHVFVD